MIALLQQRFVVLTAQEADTLTGALVLAIVIVAMLLIYDHLGKLR